MAFDKYIYAQNSTNLKQYYATCFSLIAGFMLFGGLLAPTVSSTDIRIMFQLFSFLRTLLFKFSLRPCYLCLCFELHISYFRDNNYRIPDHSVTIFQELS